METLHVFLLLSWGSMVVLSAALIGYLRYHRHEAFQGDSSAARKIILPAFEPLLWVIAFPSLASLVGFIVILAVPILPQNVPLWVSECFNSGRYFVLLIVPVLMLQKSISFAALRRAVVVTLVLSTYAIPIDWAARKAKGTDRLHPSTSSAAHALPYIATGARFAILLLYGYMFLHPPARATKRTLREYCIYAAIYHSMLMISKHLADSRRHHKGHYELMYVSMVWALIGPIVVWRVLKADTEHWRGWGQSADFPHQLSCDLTGKGTVGYMAPEVIQGRAGLASYGEAADIYSLGVTFWDILHPGCEKFPHLKNNHLHIFEVILDGERPKFDYRHADRDAELHHVIELAWQTEPERRPSAQHLVRMLERIQERECARFAGELRYDILAEKENETSIAAASRPRFSIQSSGSGSSALTQSATVTGNHAVATMVKAQLVQSRREGLRMGNMLMDAGMLHHLKHASPFEGGSVYFFDQACIQSYEPPAISILGDARGNSDMEAGACTNSFDEACGSQPNRVGFALQHAALHHNHPRVMDTRPWADSTPILSDTTGRSCRCRALSQRLEQPKASVHRKILQKIKGGHTSAGDVATPFLEDYAVTANLLIVKSDDNDDDNSEEDAPAHVEQN
uniref:Protein kinase domain-containing protein n=1 Tax=Globisporangium ultimum (strain ATCC 200006 / CBS 805.95 / DAOM BR144) TaxID=431595 RepID=K3WI82_GLOUD